MNNRPKRRKSSDNPYTLQIINNTYVVIFKDSKLEEQTVEVSEKVFNQMNEFQLDDLRELNEYDRHTEHSEVFDYTLERKSINKPSSTDEIVEKKILSENLKVAIDSLPENQKRRIKLYYFDNKTLEEIAALDGCSKVAVKYSIDNAIEKISKKIKFQT